MILFQLTKLRSRTRQEARLLAGLNDAPAHYAHKHIDGRDDDVAYARARLPKITGCVIAIHHDNAWEVKHPTPSGPKSHHVTFSGGTMLQKLQIALEWAWDKRRRQTSERRPHTFEELAPAKHAPSKA